MSIPIIGPGEVTLKAAATLNCKIGIITPSNETLDCYWDYVKDFSLDKRLVGIEAIKAPLVPCPQQDPRAMMEALVAAGQKLVAKGAELICPSGLAYIPIRVSAVTKEARGLRSSPSKPYIRQSAAIDRLKSATCRARHLCGYPEDREYNFPCGGRARSPLDGGE